MLRSVAHVTVSIVLLLLTLLCCDDIYVQVQCTANAIDSHQRTHSNRFPSTPLPCNDVREDANGEQGRADGEGRAMGTSAAGTVAVSGGGCMGDNAGIAASARLHGARGSGNILAANTNSGDRQWGDGSENANGITNSRGGSSRLDR